jgi:hypothetical protein
LELGAPLSALDQFIQERNLRHVRDGPKKPSYATDVQTAYTLFLRLASHLEHDNLARLVLGKDITYLEFLTFVKVLLITLEFDKTSSIPTDYPHGRTVHDGSGRYLTRSQVMLPQLDHFHLCLCSIPCLLHNCLSHSCLLHRWATLVSSLLRQEICLGQVRR